MVAPSQVLSCDECSRLQRVMTLTPLRIPILLLLVRIEPGGHTRLWQESAQVRVT